jgi:UDP-N-acetylglucosamine--N-acetylmuramyl-(pentapeptide) pyrophosphoryl-undecaprenol N-acetylglucosamine transferase
MTAPAKVLIMAGGTGGHIFPALTIAHELQAQGVVVEWLGTPAGLEARVVTNAGIPLHFIKVGGLRGSGALRKLAAPFVMLQALLQAVSIIRHMQPCCVLGMGGYVTGPGGLAAWLLGKKLVIHEQNAVAGMANRMLFPFAHTVMEAFAGAFGVKTVESKAQQTEGKAQQTKGKAQKVRYVGNPVRADILAIAAPAQRWQQRSGKPRWLIVGGSLGAQIFNQIVPATLALLSAEQRPLVRHQCGRNKLPETQQCYVDAGLALGAEVEVTEFIDNMADAYAWADVVLCRAGASTLAELSAIGVPALLVPYPHATDNHQMANAQHLAKLGAAKILPQDQLSAHSLKDAVLELIGNAQQALRMATAARNASVRDASQRAAQLCLEACHA